MNSSRKGVYFYKNSFSNELSEWSEEQLYSVLRVSHQLKYTSFDDYKPEIYLTEVVLWHYPNDFEPIQTFDNLEDKIVAIGFFLALVEDEIKNRRKVTHEIL